MDYHIARNGQQLGVFSEGQVQENLSNGTFEPTDLAWQEGMTDWKPLSEVCPGGEAGVTPPPVPAPSVASFTVMSPPKNSGLAIASLGCGIASFFTCGLTGLPGIICGHQALSRIRQSPGTIGGKGMAIAGLVTSYFGFLIVGLCVLAGLALPTYAKIREKGMQTQSVNHAKQIVVACMIYAQDHERKLPGTLEELLKEGIITDDKILRDPMLHDNSQIGYIYDGAGRRDTDQANTVILTSKASDSRGRKVVARIDGSVEVEGPDAKH